MGGLFLDASFEILVVGWVGISTFSVEELGKPLPGDGLRVRLYTVLCNVIVELHTFVSLVEHFL